MFKITLSLVTDRVHSEEHARQAAQEAINILKDDGLLTATEAPTVTVEHVAAPAVPVMIAVPAEHADRVRGYIARKGLI